MLSLAPTTRVFVARGATDLRRSFDRLAALAADVLELTPCEWQRLRAERARTAA